MSYLNAQTKNIGNDEGDVTAFFQKLQGMIQKNGGDHHFNWITQECTEQPAPHAVGVDSYLRLTDQNFDITQIEKSFITVSLNFEVSLNQAIDLAADTNKLVKIFVGFKDAAEIFGQNNNTYCGTMQLDNVQTEGIREQFAFNVIKGRAQKTTAKFSHSAWENISNYDQSVCGVYIDAVDLADGQPHKYNMDLTIPYTDLMRWQSWRVYPNGIVGELRDHIKTSLEGMVWAPISPSVVKEALQFLEDKTIAENVSGPIPISRELSQAGSRSTIITSFTGSADAVTIATGKVRLSVNSGTIMRMSTNIAGFKIKPECKVELTEMLKIPILVPAQEFERRPFTATATEDGIIANTDIPLRGATNITVMFPRSTSDRTCFKNIMYQNVQLAINNRLYPSNPLSTIGARFYQMQLVANELDGPLEATKEFEESYTQPLNDPVTGKRYANCRSDATSFGINFQLERSNAGYVFDGLYAGSDTVSVQFRGNPIYRGDDDTYYIPDPENKNQHPPAPELWICKDAFYTMSVDGLKYYKGVIPPGYD